MSAGSDHFNRYACEVTQSTTQQKWENWTTALEGLLGHDLDGDFTQDGYSMDHSYGMFVAGSTPEQAAQTIETWKATDRDLRR